MMLLLCGFMLTLWVFLSGVPTLIWGAVKLLQGIWWLLTTPARLARRL
jgi:small-conductance mechanosensitive channel